MERRRKKKKKLGLRIISILFCVFGIGFFVFFRQGSKEETWAIEAKEDEKKNKIKNEIKQEIKQKERRQEVEINQESKIQQEEKNVEITISVAGDFTLGNYLPTDEYNTFDDVFRKQGANYDYFLTNVKDIFKADDLTFVNLEGPLTNANEKKDKPFPFRGDPSYVKILTSGGVDVVHVANNHSHDYFEQGHQDTLQALDQAGIGYCGYGHKYITEIRGIKVGVLGYKAWAKSAGLTKILEDEIAYMKERTDLLIVSFHWGEERTYYPNEIQKYYGHKAIDLGVDLVVGHHPHVIQGIEQYKDRYIVYSLGNFCYGGHRNPPDKDTFVFQQTFVFDKQKQWLVKESNSNIIPCRISSVLDRNNYQPTPLEGTEKVKLINRMEELSRPLSD